MTALFLALVGVVLAYFAIAVALSAGQALERGDRSLANKAALGAIVLQVLACAAWGAFGSVIY